MAVGVFVHLGANFEVPFFGGFVAEIRALHTHGPCVTELADREDTKCMRHDTRPNQQSPAHQRTRQAGREAGRQHGWMDEWMDDAWTEDPKP
jgi:hypothetical protein